jgi:transposase InsO family protein
VSERFACKVLDQHRSTQRKPPGPADDEAALTAAIIELARQYGRYGYRRITALLRAEGWRVSHKRVERIWRREGLKVPARQAKRGRLWLNDGSCVRLRPGKANHVWAYDFVEDRTRDGRKIRLLNVVDEFSRECLSIRVGRKLGSADVPDARASSGIDVLADPAANPCGVSASSSRAARRATFGRTTSYIGKLRGTLVSTSPSPVCTDVGRHGNPKPGGFHRQRGALGHSKHRVRRWRWRRSRGPHRP